MSLDRLGLPRLRGQRGSRSFVAALVIDTLGTGLFLPVSLLYFTQVSQIPLGTVGWCLSAANLLTLPLPLAVGFVVDRIGARRVVAAGLALQALGFLGYLLVDRAATLLVTALVVAVGQRVFWSALFTLVADLSAPDERDRWYGLTGAAQAAGIGIGGLAAAGLLASNGTAAYKVLVVANGLTFLVATLLVVFRVPDGTPESDRDPRQAGGDGARLRRDRPFLVLIAANSVAAVCITLMSVGVPVYVKDGLQGPVWVIGILLGLSTAVLALAQTTVVRLVARMRRTRVLMVSNSSYLLWALLLVVALWVPPPWLVAYLLLITLAYTAAELLHAPTSSSLAAAASPPGARGRYLSAFQFSFAVANVVAPTLFAQLFSIEPAAPWLATAGLAALAALTMVWLERRLPADAVRPVPAREKAQV